MEKYGKMISKTPRSQIDKSVLLHMRPMACMTSELQQFIASTSAQMAFFHGENEDSPNFWPFEFGVSDFQSNPNSNVWIIWIFDLVAEEFTKYLDAIECIVSFPSGTFVQIWVGISPSPQLHFGQLAYGPTESYSRAQKFGNKFCGIVLNQVSHFLPTEFVLVKPMNSWVKPDNRQICVTIHG